MEMFGKHEFDAFRDLIYKNYGIFLNDSKKEKLRDRISKIMVVHGIKSYEELYNCLDKNRDPKLKSEFVNEITVNTTEFFREEEHFKYIRQSIRAILQNNHRVLKNKEIRVWCAGCSTGEEAYTIAITLNECLPDDVQIRILATDINTKVLEKAQRGFYTDDSVKKIGSIFMNQYFERVQGGIMVKEQLKQFVTFRLFNLMNPFPFQKGFDMIFCRNVMIYFDTSVQETLLAKYYNSLIPEGLFFIGHSETLSNKVNSFKYIYPAIYKK